MSSLAQIYVDHVFPDDYHDLVGGRAQICGQGGVEGLDVAEALVVGAARPWDAAAFRSAPAARVISRVGVGYDNVVVADAVAAGITVCNTPLAPLVSTAEHALALLFAVTKQLPVSMERARQGLSAEPVGRAMELDGRTLGLIGIGRIGSRVAAGAVALGMKVIAADPAAADPPPGVAIVGLDELLGSADVVSIHAPASAATARMINATTLAMMRPGSYLINCARGALVDHDALLAALDSGHLAGAGLDVTNPEPLPAEHPLLHRANVVVTPHCASATVAGRRRLYQHAIANALAVLAGEPADIVAAPPKGTVS